MSDRKHVTHLKKTVKPYYGRLMDGTKTYELRNQGESYQVGDTFIAEEYDPENGWSGGYIEYEIVGKDSLKDLLAAFPDVDVILSIVPKAQAALQAELTTTREKLETVDEVLKAARKIPGHALICDYYKTEGKSCDCGWDDLENALAALPADMRGE